LLTPKENYLKVLHGEIPEWIPQYTFGKMPGDTKEPPTALLEPPILIEHRLNGGGKDHWGVEYVPTYETGGALLPKPNDFILDDITKWRDVIKAPDLDGIDWEDMAKKHIEMMKIDRNQTAIAFGLHMGYFQNLMAFMGFTEGLMAMFEEPEEVEALFDYMCTFYCKVAEKVIDYYKPDIFTMMDDTAAWANPFISLDTYRELLVPVYDRQAKFGRDRGLPITFHNCGKCESFVDDMVKFGVTAWDPAQTCNDLLGIKEKYGNKLVLMGCWDGRGRLLEDDVTDEEICESAKQSIDTYAQGGGYVFLGNFLGPVDDEEVRRKNKVLHDFVDQYGMHYYDK
jgi:hypothetical protein